MKRFFTFFMAVWALLSISQTVKAADCYIMGSFDKNGTLSKLDGQSMKSLGNNQYSQEYKCTTSGKYYFRFALEGNDWQWCPYKNDYELTEAIPDYGCHKTNEEGHSGIFFFVNFESGKTYTFKCDANTDKVSCTVSAEGSGTVNPTPSGENPIANRKYSEGYYLVGNFFNFDGETINYKDAVFKFQEQKKDAEDNAVYMVQIPATLTAKAQVMSVDATGTPVAVYGPGKNSKTIDNTYPVMDEDDHTATLVFKNLEKSTDISESENDGNYWNMKSRRTKTTEGGQDGSYTIYLTIGHLKKEPSSLTIKYDDMKRVAYYLSTAEEATAMTLTSDRKNYDVQSDQGNFYAGKFYGTLYALKGSEFYAISNAMNKDVKENIFDEYKSQVVYLDNILSTYPKLFLWGNGGKPLKNTANKINAKNGTFKLNDEVVGVSSWEFNSNKGNNDDNKLWGNTGGEVQSTGRTTITSLSMVGTAIPGTTTADGEWNWGSDVADMDFDVSENCYKLTIATTDDNMNKPFRFVGNHKQAINWFENGTNPEDKAAIYPYDETAPVGHKASRSDPNEVSYTESGLTESTDENLNIIWNRPAGTWTVRFYIYTSTVGGNSSYRYFYTISKNRDLELRDFGDVVYKSEENVREILNRGEYQYFRTWSDNKAWKRPKNVDVFVVSNFTAADETHNVAFELTKINNFDTSEDVIPARTGVILALKKGAEVPGAKFYKRKSLITYNTLVIPLEEATNTGLEYTGENRLEECVKVKNIPTQEGDNVNYLFGFYQANRGLGETQYESNQFVLGFWISNGNGKFYANSCYLSIPKAKAEKLNLGTNNNTFGNIPTNSQGVKLVPALLCDFANIDSDVTGIKDVVNNGKLSDGKYYTLSGQQVEHPTAGGIYIHNGKKYIVK